MHDQDTNTEYEKESGGVDFSNIPQFKECQNFWDSMITSSDTVIENLKGNNEQKYKAIRRT